MNPVCNSQAPKEGPSSAPKRLAWLDIAKGIAIILVVTGHTISPLSPLITPIFMFHMPLFFILAGYTFKQKPFKTTVVESAKRLLIPYVLLFLVWQGVSFLKEPDPLAAETLLKYLSIFLFASGSPNDDMGLTAVGMSWFLVCLFMGRVLLSALLALFEKKAVPLPAQALVLAALCAVGIGIGNLQHLFLPLDLDIALVIVGFMWVGHLARKFDFMERWGNRWYVLAIALALFVAASSLSYLEFAMRQYGLAPLSILGAFSGTLLACWISTLIDRWGRLLKRFLVFMGRNSLMIYCFHAIDWLIPWSSLPGLQGVPLKGIVTSAVRVAHAALLTLLMKRI